MTDNEFRNLIMLEAKTKLSEGDDFLAIALFFGDPASIDAAYQQRLTQILTEWQPATAN
jgi:hypothetical protein